MVEFDWTRTGWGRLDSLELGQGLALDLGYMYVEFEDRNYRG